MEENILRTDLIPSLIRFMTKYSQKEVTKIISARIKDWDDDDGFIGDHYEVQCVTKEEHRDSIKDCLVNRKRFLKFVNNEDSPIIWK